jgi:hypothetical protein
MTATAVTTSTTVAVTAAGIRAEHEAAQPKKPGRRNDRQRFLMSALMLGAIASERMVERVLQDVEAEGAPCQ